MNLSGLVEEFAALGITVTQTLGGDLSVKPRRLLTDELRARLRAAKAVLETQDRQDAPTLRIVEPVEGRAAPVRTALAPALAVVEGQQAKPLYVIVDGVWQRPGIDALPWGHCCSCGWDGPLKTQGAEGQCALCWQDDGRRAGQPYRCETFCERELDMPLRFEPGGILSCPDCTAKMLAIKERAALSARQTNADMQQSG
jgi:hypothetical protein